MLILVMGITAAGKTTVGRLLAERLALPFHDADDFHPEENRRKMAANQPLDDDDRRPWLERLSAEATGWEREGGAVLACSALKRAYRALLFRGVREARVVYLDITREQAIARLERRRGQHAFIRDYDRVLDGQFRDLERPDPAVVVPVGFELQEIVERAAAGLFRAGFRHTERVLAERGGDDLLEPAQVDGLVDRVLAGLGRPKRVLLVPPDFTRFASGSGALASLVYRKLAAESEVFVLPALGTHGPMRPEQVRRMYSEIPPERVLVHDYRRAVETTGSVPASFVRHVSGGRVDFPVRCELARALCDGGFDHVLSIGQVVPHEVAGMAGHAKNVFVGLGGKDVIDRTHFLSAVTGIEATLGRAHTPVRDVLSYLSAELAPEPPITYLMSVRGRAASGEHGLLGLFAGPDESSFYTAAELARAVNVELLPNALSKIVVYLDPEQYRSTWLGNKAVYRTRLALADGGELVVIAPGVERFAEDPEIDALIRRHGYFGTDHTLERVAQDPGLAGTLSAAAHLIHGSSEGRFRIRYAAPGLGAEALTAVGYESAELDATVSRYDPTRLRDGLNRLPDGEEVFYVSNPGAGLWSTEARFSEP